MTEHGIIMSAPCLAHGAKGFWSRVDQSAGPDACWPWLGAVNRKGYGRRHYQGKVTLAHRVALLLTGHAIPLGHTVPFERCLHQENRTLRFSQSMNVCMGTVSRVRNGYA